ncbi:hypothetical protein C6Q05_31025 [Burkholderia multivorans]|nr:hypothetical protein C6Q05_31025 [Burkholderia multivorans]
MTRTFGRRGHPPPIRHRVAPSVGTHSSDDCAAASLLERLCSSSRPPVRRSGIPAPAPRHRACERFSDAIRRNLPIGRDSRIFREMTAQRAVAFFYNFVKPARARVSPQTPAGRRANGTRMRISA